MSYRVRLVLLLLVLGDVSVQAQPQGSSFELRQAQGWLDAPRHLTQEFGLNYFSISAAGDIDGDGRTDLLAFHFSNAAILPIWNTGVDEYELGVGFGTSQSRYVRLLDDFTGDGRPDLVTDDLEAQYGLIVHVNEGGALAPLFRIPTGDLRSWIAATGEIDGDAGRELVEIYEDLTTGDFSIRWWNWVGATLVPGNATLLGPRPKSIATGDLNDDGRDEVIVGTESSEQVFLLTTTNNASLVLTETLDVDTNPVSTTPSSICVAFGDLDGDGSVDGLLGWGSSLQVLRNDGNVPLSPLPVQAVSSLGRDGLFPVDWDGDGDLDVLTAGYELDLIENTGAFSFRLGGRVPFVAGTMGPVVGGVDLNHDGYLDYVGQQAIKSGNGRFEDLTAELLDSLDFGRVIDLDGDHDLDIVSREREILENDGSGHFSRSLIEARMSPPAATTSFTPHSVGDFDGDGELDLLVVVTGPLNAVMALIRGTGGGQYTYDKPASSANVRIGSYNLMHLAPVDLDGDGDLDVLGQDGWGSNDGSGFFTQRPDWTGSARAAADVDHDGDLDVAVSSSAGAELYLNDGAGHFTASVISGTTSGELALVDFDRDGDPEFVTSAYESGPTIRIYPNQGGNYAAVPLVFPTPLFTNQLFAFDDFDGDGRLDMLGTRPRFESNGGEATLIWRQLPGSTLAFAAPHHYYTEVRPVALGDFDGDGDLDLLRERMIRGWRNNLGRDGKIRRVPEAPTPGGVIQPELDAFGSLAAGSTLTFTVTNAPGPGWLVITGADRAQVARVPVRPGRCELEVRLPAGLAGTALRARAYFPEPNAPEPNARRGIRASNALELEL